MWHAGSVDAVGKQDPVRHELAYARRDGHERLLGDEDGQASRVVRGDVAAYPIGELLLTGRALLAQIVQVAVVDDHGRAPGPLREVVQRREVLERRHVEQIVLALLHILDAMARTHEIDVLERLPLGAPRDDIEQRRRFTGTDAADQTDATWVGETQSVCSLGRFGVILLLRVVNFDTASSTGTSTGTRVHILKGAFIFFSGVRADRVRARAIISIVYLFTRLSHLRLLLRDPGVLLILHKLVNHTSRLLLTRLALSGLCCSGLPLLLLSVVLARLAD